MSPLDAPLLHRHPEYDRQPLAPNVPGWDLLAALIGSNTQLASIFTPTRDMIATGLAFVMAVASGSSTDPVDGGMLDATATTVLASSGSTTGKLNQTGRQTLTFSSPVRLTAGTSYYAALAFGTVTTSPQILVADFASGFGVEFTGTTLGKWWGARTLNGPPLTSMVGATRNGAPAALFIRED